jgi:hypothetical protein
MRKLIYCAVLCLFLTACGDRDKEYEHQKEMERIRIEGEIQKAREQGNFVLKTQLQANLAAKELQESAQEAAHELRSMFYAMLDKTLLPFFLWLAGLGAAIIVLRWMIEAIRQMHKTHEEHTTIRMVLSSGGMSPDQRDEFLRRSGLLGQSPMIIGD